MSASGPHVLTPSTMPSPSDRPLSDSINIATRSIHSELNKLILARMPLALPPYTTNPSIYVSGLLHIAPIYSTFETLWQAILDQPCVPKSPDPSARSPIDTCDTDQALLDSKTVPITTNSSPNPLVHTPQVCSRTQSLLAHLHLSSLLRAERLHADIRVLTNAPGHKITEQLNAISKNGRLADFISHTQKSVEAKPHVLLAYAWVLYMALFSGGRYIRASLKEAGGKGIQFWTRDSSPVRPYSITRQDGECYRRTSRSDQSADPIDTRRVGRRKSVRADSEIAKIVPGMQFYDFVGDEDGEDIKREFKRRIAEVELLLTSGEKDEIVEEAHHIFKFMIQLVEELDLLMTLNPGDDVEDLETQMLLRNSNALDGTRNSIATTRERSDRRTRDSESSTRASSEVLGLSSPVSSILVNKLLNWDTYRRLSLWAAPEVPFEGLEQVRGLSGLENTWPYGWLAFALIAALFGAFLV